MLVNIVGTKVQSPLNQKYPDTTLKRLLYIYTNPSILQNSTQCIPSFSVPPNRLIQHRILQRSRRIPCFLSTCWKQERMFLFKVLVGPTSVRQINSGHIETLTEVATPILFTFQGFPSRTWVLTLGHSHFKTALDVVRSRDFLPIQVLEHNIVFSPSKLVTVFVPQFPSPDQTFFFPIQVLEHNVVFAPFKTGHYAVRSTASLPRPDHLPPHTGT